MATYEDVREQLVQRKIAIRQEDMKVTEQINDLDTLAIDRIRAISSNGRAGITPARRNELMASIKDDPKNTDPVFSSWVNKVNSEVVESEEAKEEVPESA